VDRHRWREDVLLPDGAIGRVRRGILLGSVADLPTRCDAQLKLDERLRLVNQGVGRPESTIAFGAFVEQLWTVLVLPTFKRRSSLRRVAASLRFRWQGVGTDRTGD
jgi:hypothetical protein